MTIRPLTRLKPRASDWIVSAIFALLAASLSLSSAHAAPPAGATIGNQASATYTDDSQITRTVTSNTVVTIVQQVASLTLSADGTKTSNAGGQVAYPHTLTNTGNGADSFQLTTSSNTGSFQFNPVQYFADANGDGVPDNNTPITSSGEIAAGGVFKFVAVGTVPSTAVAGNSNALIVRAASVLTPAVFGTSTDTTTITVQGVINVTQSLDVTSGPSPAGPRTITLTYTNTGNTTATGLTLTDLISSGMAYVPASARWSVTGSGLTLSDLDTVDQGGIVYDYNSGTKKVTAVIGSVLPGASGTVTFQVMINGSLPPGANPATALTAKYSYNDGVSSVSESNTNTVQYTVAQTGSVSVSSPPAITNAAQGATVSFTNVVTNNGNGRDTFNMSVINQSFPPGTTLQLFRSDGVTPLTDSNGDGLPDTGPVNAGLTYNVVVKATLPAGYSGVGPFDATVRGTSVFDPTRYGEGTDRLGAIGANSVDLTGNTYGLNAPGLGAGPEDNPVITNTVAPGNTTRFKLIVSNGSANADNFDLLAATNSGFSAALPSGWTVVFHDENGAVISNTGVINSGGHATVYADVTAPNNATTGFDVYFRAHSPSSGVQDGLHNAIAVGTVRSLVLTPNNTGQATSGGTIVYTHTIVNTGTATEGDVLNNVALSTVSSANFTSVIYWDRNNSGALDAADPVVSDLSQLTGGSNGASPTPGLSPGESARLFVKVTTSPGAAEGVTDTTTLSATVTNTIGGVAPPAAATVSDTTSIVISHLSLVKMQALDSNCDGTAEGSFSTSSLSTGAKPDTCIRYQITATNSGGTDILSVFVNDATPANTSYHATAPAACSVGSVTAPSDGAVGSVRATVGTLTPGQSAVLTFGVRIDP